MPAFRTVRRVPHSPDEMFDLVADVEKYPLFLPLCEALRIRKQEQGVTHPVLVADMTIAYKIFRETFTSRVTLEPAENRILVEYLDGPFRSLENRWTFLPAGEKSCDVSFFISYEFKSRALGALMGAVFDRAFHKFAGAFEARADQVYGV